MRGGLAEREPGPERGGEARGGARATEREADPAVGRLPVPLLREAVRERGAVRGHVQDGDRPL